MIMFPQSRLLLNQRPIGSGVMSLECYSLGWVKTGSRGMVTIAEQGGITIAQNEQSCAVFGMPQRAIEVKAASHILPLQDIASMLISTEAKNTALVNDPYVENSHDHSKSRDSVKK